MWDHRPRQVVFSIIKSLTIFWQQKCQICHLHECCKVAKGRGMIFETQQQSPTLPVMTLLTESHVQFWLFLLYEGSNFFHHRCYKHVTWLLCLLCKSVGMRNKFAYGWMLSFTFNSTVNMANKYQGDPETDWTKHQEECITYASVIANKEGQLHETGHIWSDVEINAIGKHENSRRAPTQNGPVSEKPKPLSTWKSIGQERSFQH